MKRIFTVFTIVFFTINITLGQDVSFTFANAQNTNDGGTDYYEVDVMISTTADFKLGSGQLYFNYSSTAFGTNISNNSNIEFSYPTGSYILGQVAGFNIYNSYVENDNTGSRVSFSWQQAVASGAFSDNVTTTAAALFHIKVKYLDVNEDPNFCFESSDVFDDQTYTACGPNSFALADCGAYPGTQITNDSYNCAQAALPVELIFFTAKKQNEHSLVTWKTASELNNSHFDVDYSTDGIRFHKIGEVLGAGTTIEQQSYEFLHINPEKGNNYYRLKQVDLDNAFEYSNIVTVNFEIEENNLSNIHANIYPNPTTDILNIEIQGIDKESISLSIYNSLGQVVIEERNINPLNIASLKVQSLPNGAYWLHIHGMEKTHQFIKQ